MTIIHAALWKSGIRNAILFAAFIGLVLISAIGFATAERAADPFHPKLKFVEGSTYSNLNDNWKGPRRLLEGIGANSPASDTDPGVASMHGAVSSDGRWIAFTSSRKLVDGAVEGVANIYVVDAARGGQAGKPCCVELVSVGNPTTEPTVCAAATARTIEPTNGASYKPTISKDGRFVAFVSKATNLVSHKECRSGVAGPFVVEVPSAPDGTSQIYLRDRQTGTTILVSSVLDSDTGIRQAGAGTSRSPSISANGKYLAYSSVAPGLVTVGSPTQLYVEQVYFTRLSDLATSRLSTIRAAGGDVEPILPSWEPVVNESGQFIAFTTNAVFDTVLDTNETSDVVLYEHQLDVSNEPILGTQAGLRYVSRSIVGSIGNGASSQPSITADGHRVAYTSFASNLVDVGEAADTNEQSDVFVHDLPGQSQHRVSLGSPCCQYQLQGPSFMPAISGDGKRVMFTSFDPYVIFTRFEQDYLTQKRLDRFTTASCFDAVQSMGNPTGSTDPHWPVHDTDPDPETHFPPPAEARFPKDVVATGCLPPVTPATSLDMHVYLMDLQGTGTSPAGVMPVSISDWRYRFSSHEEIDRRNIGRNKDGLAIQEVTLARHSFFESDFGNTFSVVSGAQAMSYDGQTFVFDSAADNLQQPDAVQANQDNYKLWVSEGEGEEFGCQGCTSYASLPSYGYSCLAMYTPPYGNCSFVTEDRNQAIDVYFFSRWNPYVPPFQYSGPMPSKVPPWAKP